MMWMLAGGTLLFLMILAGVLVTLLGADRPGAPVAAVAPVAPSGKPAESPPAAAARTDAVFLMEAEPLAKKFLDARRIEDLLPLVRNPGVAEARMRRHYPDGKIEAPGMAGFNTDSLVTRLGTILSIKVRTRSYEEKPLAFVEVPQGIKIDWESWVGWSDMPWEEFLASKPTTPHVFRVNLSTVDYYNFAFADDAKWQAYRLTSPDETHSIYGYAERGSKVNSSVLPPPETTRTPLILSLRFPEHATSNSQVLIEKLVADGWVLESEPPP